VSDDEVMTVVIGEHRPQGQPSEPEWSADDICAAAVDTAREALLEEVEPPLVGDHLGFIAEGPVVVTHYFAGHVPGYTGWRWAVTVTRAPDTEVVTIDETALLPDEHALLAPSWVPWKNRIQSGDLGVGDVLVTEPDDPRLIPGMSSNDVAIDDDDMRLPEQWELGLGRQRMLSPEGRREAAHRWYREAGPRAQIARAADLDCASCGFLLLIGGPMGQAFGVCANGFSPVDGRIVALDFGCGAHSETVQQPVVPVAEIVVDEVGYDTMPVAEESETAGEQASAPDAPGGDAQEPVPDAQMAAETDEDKPAEVAPAADEEQSDGAVTDSHETMQGIDSEEDS
jgi:hypothetical protein